MHLLITRPEPDASETAARLQQLGHQTTTVSMLEPEFFPEPTGLVRPTAIFLTSGNATRAVARWPILAEWRDIPAFCVGDHTAELARSAGFQTIHSAEGDTEDLAKLIRDQLRPQDGPFLYATTDARSGNLAESLAQSGYAIEILEVYRMKARESLPDSIADAIRQGSLDGVLLYSRRTSDIFCRLIEARDLKAASASLVLYAMSRKVAEPLDFGRVLVSAEPTEGSLFEQIQATLGTLGAGIR